MSKYLLLLYIDVHIKLLVPHKVIPHGLLFAFLYYLLVGIVLNHLLTDLSQILKYCLDENLYELFQHYGCLKVPLQGLLKIQSYYSNNCFQIDLNNFSNFHHHNMLRPSYNLWYQDLELFHNTVQHENNKTEDEI